MTGLQRRCLSVLPITPLEVDAIYRLRIGDNSDLSRQIRRLCESHERLRSELDGAEVLHDQDAKAIKAYRDGLLRIFARCENWSAVDIRANVADMLGVSVAEAERMASPPDPDGTVDLDDMRRAD